MSRGPACAAGLLAAALLCQAAPASAQPMPADSTQDGARPGNEIGTGMSLPRSDSASNLDFATTHSALAPRLPSPPAGEDIQALLLSARAALTAGRTGEAQEALERAESRALDRSVPAGTERVPAAEALPGRVAQARSSLAAGDLAGAVRLINEALPEAADASLPP